MGWDDSGPSNRSTPEAIDWRGLSDSAVATLGDSQTRILPLAVALGALFRTGSEAELGRFVWSEQEVFTMIEEVSSESVVL